MGLWVRSQNKEILKRCDAVILDGLGFKITIFEGEPEEYCLTDENDIVLARYNSKKRALEVLDEIQNILSLKDMYKYDKEILLKGWESFSPNQIQTIRQQMSVYEMPKE